MGGTWIIERMTVCLTGMESGQNLPCCVSHRHELSGTFGQNEKDMHTWGPQKPWLYSLFSPSKFRLFMNISSVHYLQEQLLAFSTNYIIRNHFPDQLLELTFILTRRDWSKVVGMERSRHRAKAWSDLAVLPEQGTYRLGMDVRACPWGWVGVGPRSWMSVQRHYLEMLILSMISDFEHFFLSNISSPKVTEISSLFRMRR